MERDPVFDESHAEDQPRHGDARPCLSGAALEQAMEKARLSYAAGNGVEHDVVTLWLKTWGTPNRRPFREWLAAPDG